MFARQLSSITTTHAEFPIIRAEFKAHPRDARLAAKMAGLYAGRGEMVEAEAALG